MDDYDNLPLAEFYFYTIGDKDVYNQELNDLFVCYTLTRGLQIQCDSPRRPALPLELILRITRFAGFVNYKPDITLTSEAFIFTKSITEGPYSAELYITERLSRVQLASMARLQLVESSYGGDLNQLYYDRYNPRPYKWAFIPLGRQDEKFGFPSGSKGTVATLFPCRDQNEAEAVKTIHDDVVISETFTEDHPIGKLLDDEDFPCVVVIARQRSLLLVWRWWEPQF